LLLKLKQAISNTFDAEIKETHRNETLAAKLLIFIIKFEVFEGRVQCACAAQPLSATVTTPAVEAERISGTLLFLQDRTRLFSPASIDSL
jgi:hypothetical protein